MILKASQRAGAKALARHLLNDRDNDHVTVHELRGFVADDVEGAFREVEALSKATKAKSYLFSVSINPPANNKVSTNEIVEAADRIEQTMGLEKQPRCIIFHEKEGRRHAHCVWSRIDTEEIKAIKLPFYKKRLNGLSRELYIENGWELPKGFEHKHSSDPRSFNLAEWQQAKRQNLNPQQIKARLQHCWKYSDNKASFTQALNHEGFFLAKGDRRGYVALDWQGEIYSLSRTLSVKSKDLKARLGDSNALPSVDETKANIAKEQTALHIRLRKSQALTHATERKPLNARKAELIKQQREARIQQKMAQAKRQLQEQQHRQAQYQKGLKGLWHFVTGRYHKQKSQHEAEYQSSLERDNLETHALISKQLEARQKLQTQIDAVKNRQQKEIMTLNAQMSRSEIKEIKQGLNVSKSNEIQNTSYSIKPNINPKAPEMGL